MTAFEEVYRTYFKDVQMYLLALCKDPDLAEELTALTFFKALHSLDRFRGDCDIRTWLFAIGKNCYLSHLRKEKRELPLEHAPSRAPDPSLEDVVVDQRQAIQIHKILHSLPEPYKEVFSLRVFGQLSYGTIGEIFGRTQNWACVTYHRARQKIINEMEGII